MLQKALCLFACLPVPCKEIPQSCDLSPPDLPCKCDPKLIGEYIRYLPSMCWINRTSAWYPITLDSGWLQQGSPVATRIRGRGWGSGFRESCGELAASTSPDNRGAFGKRFPSLPDLSQKGELAQIERIIRLAKATDISLGS